MSRSMSDTYLLIKLPFYLGYIYKVNVEVKGRGHRSMSRSDVWDIAVNKVSNQVLTFLGLNENEKKKKKKKNIVKP